MLSIAALWAPRKKNLEKPEEIKPKLYVIEKTDKPLFGMNDVEIKTFIEELAQYPWFTEAGSPHPDDKDLIRVGSFSEGFDSIFMGKRGFLKNFHRIRQLHDTAVAAGTLTQASWENACSMPYKLVKSMEIKRHNVKIDESVQGKVAAWASNAALEMLVSFMPGCPDYFRRLIPWYKAGFWPVAIRDTDDKLIVY